LNRRHLPLGWICGIENALRGHFDEVCNLESVDWVEEADSYRRLFTHMVAQYLGLCSRSDVVEPNQSHYVIVENPLFPEFLPPCRRLIEHIKIDLPRDDV
jgi:hypothetical protein